MGGGLTDKRDECGCHKECTTLEHKCEKPCRWPSCLTQVEQKALVASLMQETIIEPKATTVTVYYDLIGIIPGLHQTDIVFAADEWAEMSPNRREEACREIITDLLADMVRVNDLQVKTDEDDSEEEDKYEFRI